MSLGDGEAKFPTESFTKNLPPSPTRENPGAVFPRSSPTPASPQEEPGARGAPRNPESVFGNPYFFDAKISKLEKALDEMIDAIDKEASAGAGVDISEEEGALLHKFKQWRHELDVIRRGGHPTSYKEPRETPDLEKGGMFTD